MSINAGWLKDSNGDKFAPKTLASQIQTNEGTSYAEQVTSDINAVQAGVDEVSDDLATHTGNGDIHVTANQKTQWDAAYTHSQAAHVQVADSVTSTSTSTAATSKNVKQAYDLANTANTAVGTLNDEFDDHVADTTAHMTSAQKTQLSTAYSHSQATHARTDATNVTKSNTNGNILINGTETVVYTHPTGTNPHGTTKADVGLGNVDNTSDANKPVSTAQKAAIDAVQSNLDTVDDKVDDHINNDDIHFTKSERSKLESVESGATNTVVDSSLSTVSKNPVENQAITNWLADNVKNYRLTVGNGGSLALSSEEVDVAASAPSDAQVLYTVDVDATTAYFGSLWENVTSKPTTLSGYGITDAEPKGTATSTVNTHNSSASAHNDIRLLYSELNTKVTNFLNVDDTTKDQLSEIIALIEANADDIEAITSGKVNVADIINNLTTNVTNKPLSAAQGVALKALIDDLQTAVNTAQTTADSKVGTVSLASGTNNGTVKLTVDGKVTDNIAVKGLGSAAYTASTAYDQSGAANTALTTAKAYTDELASDVIYMVEEGSVAMVGECTNQIPISTDTDGSIYNGIGYKNGYRWSSSGNAEVAGTNMAITGYIPCVTGDTVRIKNITLSTSTSSYIVLFDSNKTCLGTISKFGEIDVATGVYTIAITEANVAYIRISGGTMDETSVVTINQNVIGGTFNTGWLQNYDGDQLAPNTFISQVFDEEGNPYSAILDENFEKLDATNVAYGTCSTAATTAAKVITISGNSQWKLQTGSMITVKFSATNTAENPTFNVNDTGAKSVWYNTALITTGSLSYAGYANRPSIYMYDGTQYVWLGWAYDANSDTKVTQNAAITTAGEYPILLGYSTSTSKVTNVVNKTSTLKYNPSTKVLSATSFNGNLTGNVTGNADTATTLTGLTSTVAELNILDGVTATAAEINKLDGLTATTTELNYVDGVTSNIQTQLDGKFDATGGTINGYVSVDGVVSSNSGFVGDLTGKADSADYSTSTNSFLSDTIDGRRYKFGVDSNGIYVIEDTFTFYIDDISYQSGYEMTWEDWINSDYNTIEASISEEYDSILVSGAEIMMNGISSVCQDDLIIANTKYVISETTAPV